jgi:hypothetical protein
MEKENGITASISIGAPLNGDKFSILPIHYLPVDVSSRTAEVPVYEDVSHPRFGPTEGEMAVEVRAGGIALRISEESSSDYGRASQQFLDVLREELQSLLAIGSVEEVANRFKGTDSAAVGCKFASNSTAHIKIWGNVSPSIPGFIRINIDGETLYSSEPEWLGGSSDPTKTFYFFADGYRHTATSNPTTVQIFFNGSSFERPEQGSGAAFLATCEQE